MKLLERDDHLGALTSQLSRAQRGRGGMAIVSGESGAGKSTLLQAFMERVDAMPVLWGACDPLTTPRPLGPFHDLAAQLGDEVTSTLRTATQPHEIFAAVFEHLRVHPSVLIVDDLHRADQGTIDLLRFLLRRIRVTSSWRPRDRAPTLHLHQDRRPSCLRAAPEAAGHQPPRRRPSRWRARHRERTGVVGVTREPPFDR
jgi:predicted ATPase